MFKIQEKKLENEFVRIIIGQDDTKTAEGIEIKENRGWIPILSSFSDFSTLLFCEGKNWISKVLSFKEKTGNKLIYELNDSELFINLDITLNDIIHFKYTIKNKKKLKLSSLIANYSILLGKDPDFKWVPHLRPNKNFIIPDHVFRSPVIIYKKGKFSFALIPDLEILGKNRPFQTMMNLNLKYEKNGSKPRIYYGFGRYKPVYHIMFEHKRRIRIKPNTNLSFGYYIKVFNGASVLEILQYINQFLWNKYGKNLLYQDLAPQILPYDINADEGFKAIERHNFWGNFKINNVECGGSWHRSWMGKKQRVKFIKPRRFERYYRKKLKDEIFDQESSFSKIIFAFSNSPFWMKQFDKLTRHHGLIERPAEIWNNAWFLNIRTGYALKYFGELWNDDNLIDKGNRVLNTLLNLPRTSGLFPSVVLPAALDSTEVSFVNGVKAFVFTDLFHVVDSCLAMYWALKYYQDYEKNEEILKKSNELLNLLEKIQLDNGTIPTYLSFDEDKKPVISDILIDSASSGAPLMFLMELFKISKNERIIPIAEKIAKYLQNKIIPIDKWHDYEPFFSCTKLPMNYYDSYTKSHAMNNLCIYWGAEGFKELYKATQNSKYLESGERILAILSLFQQVWNLPYINYNTCGGFGCQNTDAELSDARQGLFVRVYMEYYLITGKKEYMERGIATLRACWAMQLLKEYKEQCPGNLEGIETLDGIDRGCVTENYGHSGNDLRVPGYIMFDWGVGTSASATAYVKKHFGDIFIDFKEKIVWGIDGINIKSFKFEVQSVKIFIDKIPGKKYIIFKGRNSPEDKCELVLNGQSIGYKDKLELDKGFQYYFK